jgi:receptor-type tyrosine-protein phosphatase F
VYFYFYIKDSIVLICHQAVFGELEEGAVYLFRVKAHTTKGAGPWSDVASFTVDRDVLRSPLAVNAVATSDTSVEVWWEPVPNRGKVIGYQVRCSIAVSRIFSLTLLVQIFYTMTAVEDLDAWSHKIVGLTESIELVNLEKFAQYAVAVAARTKTVNFANRNSRIRANVFKFATGFGSFV